MVGCLAGLYDGLRVKFNLPVSRSTGGPVLLSVFSSHCENDVESSLNADGELILISVDVFTYQ